MYINISDCADKSEAWKEAKNVLIPNVQRQVLERQDSDHIHPAFGAHRISTRLMPVPDEEGVVFEWKKNPFKFWPIMIDLMVIKEQLLQQDASLSRPNPSSSSSSSSSPPPPSSSWKFNRKLYSVFPQSRSLIPGHFK